MWRGVCAPEIYVSLSFHLCPSECEREVVIGLRQHLVSEPGSSWVSSPCRRHAGGDEFAGGCAVKLRVVCQPMEVGGAAAVMARGGGGGR